MNSKTRATSRTGMTLTLTQLKNDVPSKKIFEHQLLLIHQKCLNDKSFEARLTSILQKEINLSYSAARFIKLAMLKNKTIIPVSRMGIRFRSGIAKPNPQMIDFIIRCASEQMNDETNHSSKKEISSKKEVSSLEKITVRQMQLSDFTSEQLVEELRHRGLIVKAYKEY